MMTETQFLTLLKKSAKNYRWQLTDGGAIRAVGKTRPRNMPNMFDPVTAVAREVKRRNFDIDHVQDAADLLGMPEWFVDNVEEAVDNNTGGRGYAQILRGRIRRTLKL